jgi:hypothetical protein
MTEILKNCIVIDLTISNYQNLGRIVESANVKHLTTDMLAVAKKNGYAKLFISTTTATIIAFTTKEDRKTIYFIDDFFESLHEIEPVKIKKPELTESTINKILDKLSKLGKTSLTKTELETLDKYSTL